MSCKNCIWNDECNDNTENCKSFSSVEDNELVYFDEGNADEIANQIADEITNRDDYMEWINKKDEFNSKFIYFLGEVCELRFSSPTMQNKMFEALYDVVYQKVVELINCNFILNGDD